MRPSLGVAPATLHGRLTCVLFTVLQETEDMAYAVTAFVILGNSR